MFVLCVSSSSDLQDVFLGLSQQAGDGLVAHGAHTADLQPLQQTLLVEGVGTQTHSQLILAAELLQTHGTRLTNKTEYLSCSFQNNLISMLFSRALLSSEQVAAEEEAEQEDEEGDANDDDVDVEGQVVQVRCVHVAFEVGALGSGATQAPVAPLDGVHGAGRPPWDPTGRGDASTRLTVGGHFVSTSFRFRPFVDFSGQSPV